MTKPSERIIKVVKEEFLKELRRIIAEDKFLTKVSGWESQLEAFQEFTYVNDEGVIVTLIKNDS